MDLIDFIKKSLDATQIAQYIEQSKQNVNFVEKDIRYLSR